MKFLIIIHPCLFIHLNFRLSWRQLGDPQLLNADGFTYFWSPWYDSGSSAPICSYWPGKYSSGTRTANMNGFLNFYTIENRHIFEVGKTVSRTYHIWLPAGPVTAGYAVDACWQPPAKTPVTDPVADFPVTANGPECYRFKVVINDGNPLTTSCCEDMSPHECRVELERWYWDDYGNPYHSEWAGFWNDVTEVGRSPADMPNCGGSDHPDWYCDGGYELTNALNNGTYQFLGYEFHSVTFTPSYKKLNPAFDVFELNVSK